MTGAQDRFLETPRRYGSGGFAGGRGAEGFAGEEGVEDGGGLDVEASPSCFPEGVTGAGRTGYDSPAGDTTAGNGEGEESPAHPRREQTGEQSMQENEPSRRHRHEQTRPSPRFSASVSFLITIIYQAKWRYWTHYVINGMCLWWER